MSDVAPKKLLRVLSGETLDPPPVWLMRQAGRYLPEYRALRTEAPDFLSFCFTPDLAVEATLQPIRRYGFDAAIMFCDILVIPHALGQKVWFEEGQGPKLAALESPADLDRLGIEDLHGPLAPVYETLGRLSRELPGETALIGFAGAPWTVASYMIEGGSSRDFAKAKSWAYRDPDSFSRLIDLLVDATAAYLIRQVAAGAEVLQIFDSWAGVWPEAGLRRWCLEPACEIVRRIRAACPAVPVILFPRGGGVNYADFARESGAQGLSLDTTLPLDWAAKTLQPHAALQGNLDPILLAVGGAGVADAVRDIRAKLGGGPMIFNLGHGIVPQTDPDEVTRLLEAVRA